MKTTILASTLLGLLATLSHASPTAAPPSSHTFAKRAVDVLTPRWGYTVQSPGNHTEIFWTEPTTRDIEVTLVRGAPGQLVAVGPYDSYVDNDGRYEWLNEDYDDTDLKSGCDYKFRLSIQEDEDDFGESEYFVIVRDGDGGLTDDTLCPGPRGREGEAVRYGDLASQAAAQPTAEAQADDAATTEDVAGGSVQTDNSVSRTTLIIAVVVSDIGILLLLAAVVFFGRRRSWFVSRDFLASYVGLVQKAQARLDEQGQIGPGQMYLKRNGNAPGKEESYVDVSGGEYGTGTSSGYGGRSEAGGRDVRIAQLE